MLDGRSRELEKVSGPIVVRLTGCPLIDLPRLSADGRPTGLGRQVLGSPPDQRGRAAPGDQEILRAFAKGIRRRPRTVDQKILDDLKTRMTIRHAVIVSEYGAMLQNAMDAQSWQEGDSLCRRLPYDTVRDDRGGQRFWMLLGVQVGDQAIRQRVSHVVAWYPGSDPRSDSAPPTSRRDDDARARTDGPDGEDLDDPDDEGTAAGIGGLGVLVSRHVGYVEQDLLYWNRFDIVENADVHLFADDLQHVAAQHLSPAGGGVMVKCDA
jgi:hypothetical protein